MDDAFAKLKLWSIATIGFLAAGLVSTFQLWQQGGVVGHNWDWPVNFDPGGARVLAHAALSTWWSLELGLTSLGASIAPFAYLSALFADHAGFYSHLLLIVLPTLGALAAMALCGEVLAAMELQAPLAAWIGGLAFGYSPLFFNEMHGGALTQVLAHASLALVIALVVRFRTRGDWPALLIAAICSPLVALSVTDFALMYGIAAILLFGNIRAFGVFAAAVLGLNLYWLLPFIYNIPMVLRAPSYAATVGNLSTGVPQPWQLFTLSGYFFSFFDNAQPNLVAISGIAALVLVFGSIWLTIQSGVARRLAPFWVMFFLGIGSASVAAGPLAQLMLWIYGHVPGVNALFRSPQHLLIVPAISGAVIIGCGSACALRRWGERVVIVIPLLGIALAARLPYFTGDMSSKYLTALYPGHGFSTFTPSPGYLQALQQLENLPPSERYKRPLFVPPTLSPLYKRTRLQSAAQGGDPSMPFLRDESGSIAGLSQALTPDGAIIEDGFFSRFPESLETGLSGVLDISHVVLRYDILANWEPFAQDPLITLKTQDVLDRDPRRWKRVLDEDFVRLYKGNAPPHVFLSGRLLQATADPSDFADVELANSTSAIALSGASPSLRFSRSDYSFEPLCDWQIERSAADQPFDIVTRRRTVVIDTPGDYIVAVKWNGIGQIAVPQLQIDGRIASSSGAVTLPRRDMRNADLARLSRDWAKGPRLNYHTIADGVNTGGLLWEPQIAPATGAVVFTSQLPDGRLIYVGPDDRAYVGTAKDFYGNFGSEGARINPLSTAIPVTWSSLFFRTRTDSIDVARRAGARWARYAIVPLSRGKHVLEWSSTDGVRAFAVIPHDSIPEIADYDYPDASVIGIRGPEQDESVLRTFNLAAPRRLNVSAVVFKPAGTVAQILIDGKTYALGLKDRTYSKYARTVSVSIDLRAGDHTLRFPTDGSVERVFLIRDRLPADNIEALSLKKWKMFLWVVDVPARTKPVVLGFLESYNNGWILREIPNARHIVLDGYANGWILPAGPEQQITIFYKGQVWVWIGEVASTIALLIVLAGILLKRRART
ncbi:MAG: hypothetical protein ABSE64_07475 [Vulcanimicrobiaceae bacterium]|jgi:hypothetical protein